MNEILDLKKLEKVLSNRWKAILSSAPERQYKTIVEYLSFLEEQYEKGAIGYILYPYYITSLLAIDGEKHIELEEIIDLAAELEIPNIQGETNPRSRLDETENLSEMIRKL